MCNQLIYGFTAVKVSSKAVRVGKICKFNIFYGVPIDFYSFSIDFLATNYDFYSFTVVKVGTILIFTAIKILF